MQKENQTITAQLLVNSIRAIIIYDAHLIQRAQALDIICLVYAAKLNWFLGKKKNKSDFVTLKIDIIMILAHGQLGFHLASGETKDIYVVVGEVYNWKKKFAFKKVSHGPHIILLLIFFMNKRLVSQRQLLHKQNNCDKRKTYKCKVFSWINNTPNFCDIFFWAKWNLYT